MSALTTLLTIAADASCRPTALEVVDAASGRPLRVYDPRIETDTGVPARAPAILLPRPHLDLQHLATWLTTYDALRPVPSLVAAAIDSPVPGLTLEARLLELATAAEGLHRRLDPEARNQAISTDQANRIREAAIGTAGDNPDVIKRVQETLSHLRDLTYAARLQALLDRTASAVPDVAGQNPTEWIRQVKKARNGFAHLLPSAKDAAADDQWRALYTLSMSLRWLLAAVLLFEAGVQGSTIAERLTHHDRYQTFLAQARRDLPGMYAP